MSSENPTRTGNECWKSSPPPHDGNVKQKLHQNLQRTPVITATRKCQVKTLPELATNAGSHHRRHMTETSSENSTRTCNERWRSSPARYTEMSSENPTRTGNECWKSSPPSHDGNVKQKLHQNLQRMLEVITATRKCQVKTLPEPATNAGSHHRRHMMETSSKNSTRT